MQTRSTRPTELKIVHPPIDSDAPDDSDDTFRMERRRMDRWPMQGGAAAVHLGGPQFGESHRLRIENHSQGGLAAVSDEVIEPGSVVLVEFDGLGVPSKRATILRCQPCGDGYRVAVRYEMRMAA